MYVALFIKDKRKWRARYGTQSDGSILHNDSIPEPDITRHFFKECKTLMKDSTRKRNNNKQRGNEIAYLPRKRDIFKLKDAMVEKHHFDNFLSYKNRVLQKTPLYYFPQIN